MNADPLNIIAAPPPDVPDAVVAALLAREYDLRGSLTPLVSERDQNFRLRTAQGRNLVVKIANAAEAAHITDFQVQALRFLEDRGCPVAVPRVIPTKSGAVSTTIRHSGARNVLRLVSYLPGTPLEGAAPGAELAFELGKTLALLDRSLAGFSHPGQSQDLLWDMQRAGELDNLVQHVPAGTASDIISDCLQSFRTIVEPALPSLRAQVIHNDLNPGNILVDNTAAPVVSGVIDFGDMVRAPLVIDVAIAASYLRATDDGLATMRSMVEGFESVTPLHEEEKRLLFDLIRTRLATTVVILYWRAAVRPSDDPYLVKALQERSAERFLKHLSALGRESVSHGLFGPEKTS